MKKNMSKAMDRLEIDTGIRSLIRQLWKHGYRTIYGCEGHYGRRGYVMFSEGDGWFERSSRLYGLEKLRNNSCCENPLNINCCTDCGAGIKGNQMYVGPLNKHVFRAIKLTP